MFKNIVVSMAVVFLHWRSSLHCGECPTSVAYHQHTMRKHLLHCVVNGRMDIFPSTKQQKIGRPISTVKVVIAGSLKMTVSYQLSFDLFELIIFLK